MEPNFRVIYGFFKDFVDFLIQSISSYWMLELNPIMMELQILLKDLGNGMVLIMRMLEESLV